MKQLIKYVMLMMISIMVVSCNKDDDQEEPNNSYSLVGTWISRNYDDDVDFTICFKKNGSGWMKWSDEDENYTFSYSATGGRIFFNDGYDYWQCEYVIKGEKLTIYGNPWGEDDDINVISFIRK
ncbi:MAG: hypothetical protein K2H49_03840 [Muribaculaceae bacterium]|nr:hypothetical protein [Muribaculaceae bacterium]